MWLVPLEFHVSYVPLARKYRPASFDDVLGQTAVIVGLQHALNTQKLANTYLLTGTRGVGKTTLARLIATAVNCERGISFSPCGSCESCLSSRMGTNPDIYEVDGASKTKVEDMRSLLENTHYMPLRCRYKVYIIDEVHMLSNHAFNALLKTLEEPLGHILFILATTELEKVPMTVRSRCVHYALLPFSEEQILHRCQTILDKEHIPYDESLAHVAKAAHGSMRDALTLLEQIIHIGQGHVLKDNVHALLSTIPQHLLEGWVNDLLSGDITRLHTSLEGLQTTAPSCKNMLEKLLALWFEHTYKALHTTPTHNFVALYDITLLAIDQLSCVPDVQLHLQMVWLKLWHTLHCVNNVTIHVQHTPSLREEIHNIQPTTLPPSQDKTPMMQFNSPQDFTSWIMHTPLLKGLMKETLKHMTLQDIEDMPKRMYHFHYPTAQEALFQPTTQKKIIAFLLEHTDADHITLHAVSSASPLKSPPQSTPALTEDEKAILSTLGYTGS